MRTCVIVDDDQHAIDGLIIYINAIPDLEIIRIYTDPVQALNEILSGSNVDLIFMDIDMPTITGIELSKEVRRKTNKLVFTTSHSEYAYQAFEVDADAFLLKPYSLARFVGIYNKLFPGNVIFAEPKPGLDEFILIKSKEDNNKLIRIDIKDIIAVESQNNYVQVHTSKGTYLTYISLSEISKTIMVYPEFIQYQRSFILSKRYIATIEGNMIQMANGTKITVGEYYKKDFNTFVKEKLVKAQRRR